MEIWVLKIGLSLMMSYNFTTCVKIADRYLILMMQERAISSMTIDKSVESETRRMRVVVLLSFYILIKNVALAG